ncbi:MAG: flippase-like domain-containing protein [Chloroflexi bacterium]|nr:flippase-like domain-containing protein [Chloroflexota bacterium]
MLANRKILLGFVISAALLALFLLTVDIGRMFDAVLDANYWWLIPGVAMYLVSVLFRTLRWHVLLRHIRPIAVRRLYPVVVVGYMANNLLPMRLGELVRSYYVGEREGISKTAALTTIFVERVLDALILLFFILIIALFVPLSGVAEGFGERSGIAWPLLVVGLSAPFVLVFGALVLFALYPLKTRALALTMARPLPERLESRLAGLIDMFLHGLMPLRDPRTLAALFALSAPIWLFEAGLFFFTGFAFRMDPAFDNPGEMAVAMVLVTAIANIGSSIPAAPGGIGLFELVARETLVLMPLASIDRPVAGGFAAVVHLALLLPMIVMGQVFLWIEHLSLRKLSRGGQRIGERASEQAVSTTLSPDVEK